MTAPEKPEALCCPHCSAALPGGVVTRVMDKSRMQFVITPAPGELLSARTVGGTIEQMEKLLVAIGKDMGVKTTVLVEGVSSTQGEIKVDLLVARHEPGIKKRKEQTATVSAP